MSRYSIYWNSGKGGQVHVSDSVIAANAANAVAKFRKSTPQYRGEKLTARKSTKNPQTVKFPKGKFVKVQAVRVNRDGTITVKK